MLYILVTFTEHSSFYKFNQCTVFGLWRKICTQTQGEHADSIQGLLAVRRQQTSSAETLKCLTCIAVPDGHISRWDMFIKTIESTCLQLKQSFTVYAGIMCLDVYNVLLMIQHLKQSARPTTILKMQQTPLKIKAT